MNQNMEDIQFMPELDMPDFDLPLPDADHAGMHNFGAMGFPSELATRLPPPSDLGSTDQIDTELGSSHHNTHQMTNGGARGSARSQEEQLHQMKIQHLSQLQQMQTQIFHTHLELYKLTQSLREPDKGSMPLTSALSTPYSHGLPTPLDSMNLLPQAPPLSAYPSPDLISPMIPAEQMQDNGSYRPDGSRPLSNYPSPYPFHAASAPASIAFATNTTPLVSPTRVEPSDLSPIPSPWLRPTPDYLPMSHQPGLPSSSRKRRSMALGEERHVARSMVETGSQPTQPQVTPLSVRTATGVRAPKRLKNSTSPASPGAADATEMPNSSTSDASMPPPPSVQGNQYMQHSAAKTSEIARVTPSSIMGLEPPVSQRQTRSSIGVTPKAGQAKAFDPVTSTRAAASKGNNPHPSTASAPSSRTTAQKKSIAQPLAQPPKKHTHKDAEQKRRDSLKTSFDDLRDLLPPIPLALEDPRFAENPPLPGSLPPRGPPKGDGGPNRHVSKLHLLRCGNDYLRQLKGRVDRRDTEISNLRAEILRLRTMAREHGAEEDLDDYDLEKDLDFEAESHFEIGAGELMGTVAEGEEDGNDS